jgi:hypothetical protein
MHKLIEEVIIYLKRSNVFLCKVDQVQLQSFDVTFQHYRNDLRNVIICI